MDLQRVVDRYAEVISYIDQVDSHDPGGRADGPYRRGFKALGEPVALEAINIAWQHLHPHELVASDLNVRYPTIQSRTSCDHVFTTRGERADEWGIEFKRLQFVGNNGKRNDYALGKVLSPYLKDRSLLHDAARLRYYGFTRRIAVVAYAFNYDLHTVAEARRRHIAPRGWSAESLRAGIEHHKVIDEVADVVLANGGHMKIRPLMEFADAILGLRGFTTGPRAQAEFEAWRHPSGGTGTVFGWEIRRPELEPDFDPRHPW
jgi:hypothetical protein